MEDKKSYYVQIPGTPEGQTWDEEKFNRNRDALLEQYPDAVVNEVSSFSADQEIGDSDSFEVTIPGTPEGQTWDAAKFKRNQKALYEQYPDVQVNRVRAYQSVNAQPAQQATAPVEAAPETQEAPQAAKNDSPLDWRQKMKYTLQNQQRNTMVSGALAQAAEAANVTPQAPEQETFEDAFTDKVNTEFYYKHEKTDEEIAAMTPEEKAEYEADLAKRQEDWQKYLDYRAGMEEVRKARIAAKDAKQLQDEINSLQEQRKGASKEEKAQIDQAIAEKQNALNDINVPMYAQQIDNIASSIDDIQSRLQAISNGDFTGTNAQAYEEQSKLQLAQSLYEDAMSAYGRNAKGDGTTMVGNALRSFKDEITDGEYWYNFFHSAYGGDEVRKVLKKVEEAAGSLKSEDIDKIDIEDLLDPADAAIYQAFMRKTAAEMDRAYDTAKGYQAGETVADMIPFIVEMMLTRGLQAKASEGTVKALRNVLAGSLKKIANPAARRAVDMAGKYAISVVKRLEQAAAAAAVVPSTTRAIQEELTSIDEEGHLRSGVGAYALGFTKNAKEYFTEMMGEELAPIMGDIVKATSLDKVYDAYLKNGITDFAKKYTTIANTGKFAYATGWGSLGAELLEEVEGAAVDQLVFGEKDAWKNFWDKENLLEMVAGFAPMAILGVPGTLVQLNQADKSLTVSERSVQDAYRLLGWSDDEWKIFFTGMRQNAELNPERLAQQVNYLSDQLIDKLDANTELTDEQKEDILDSAVQYTAGLARYHAYLGSRAAQQEQEREKEKAGIVTSVGQDFWGTNPESGKEEVRIVTDNKGKRSYLLGYTDKGEAVVVDGEGNKSFVSPNNIVKTDTIGLEDYLTERVGNRAAIQQLTRMNKEKTAKVNAVLSQLRAGETEINFGTNDEPVMGSYMGADADGVIVEFAKPTVINGASNKIHHLKLEEVAPLLPNPVDLTVYSDEELNQLNQVIEDEKSGVALRDQLNKKYKRQKFSYEGQNYKFKKVYGLPRESNGDTIVSVVARDKNNRLVNIDMPISQLGNSPIEDTIEEKDGVAVDTKGAPMPMKEDGNGGKVVDGEKLWSQDKKAWSQWNDQRRGDGGNDSRRKITNTYLPAYQAERAKLEKQLDQTTDDNARDDIYARIAKIDADMAEANKILADYAEAERKAAEELEEKKKNLILEQKKQLIEDRTAMIKRALKGIKSKTPTFIVTLDTIEEVMSDPKMGFTEANKQKVRNKVEYLKSHPNMALNGFHLGGKIFLFAEYNHNEVQVRTTFEHEDQHRINKYERPELITGLMELVADGKITLKEVEDAVVAMSGDEGYRQRKPGAPDAEHLDEMADEFLAFSKELLLDGKSLDEFYNKLGIINEELKKYGEQTVATDVPEGRRHVSISGARAAGNRGDAEDLDFRTGQMGAEDLGSDGRGEQEIGEAVEEEVVPATEEVEQPESLLSEQTKADLDKVGLTETSGLIMDPAHAELKAVTGYETPNERDLDADQVRFSITTLGAWGRNYLKLPNSEARVVEVLNRWAERAAVNELVSGVISQGNYKYSAPKSGVRAKGNPVGPLRTNIEYVVIFDMDTTCPRTFEYLNLSKKIEKRIGRPLTQRECIQLIELMRMNGQQIPCVYCYAENKRQLMKQYYTDFMRARNGVLGAKTKDQALKAMYGHGTTKTAKASNDPDVALTEAAAKVFKRWWADRAKLYNPTIQELWAEYSNSRNSALAAMDQLMAENVINQGSADGTIAKKVAEKYGIKSDPAIKVLEDLAGEWKWDVTEGREHMDFSPVNEIAINEEAFNLWREMTAYAKSASSAKNVDRYIPYTDELRYISQEDRDYINGMGGLRMHSTNDFRIDYVLDYFQFMADMAEAGMMGHTYTKNPDFVRIFGNSGYKINMSIAAYEDEDGNIAENSDEGFDWRIAQELRSLYPNAGVMLMATSDNQIQMALDSDWVDMFIPFHASGLPTVVWGDMRAWTNYTGSQNEGFYNATQMKERLDAAGVSYDPSLKDQALEDFFCETFNIIRKYATEGKDAGKRVKPHFLPGPTIVGGVEVPGWHKPGATQEEDTKEYLRLCNEWGVNPRFYDVMVKDKDGNQISLPEHPNYLKCIKETARMDTPQTAIHFDFDKPSEDPTLGGMSPLDWALDQLEKAAIREKNMAGKAVRDIYESTKQDAFGLEEQFMDSVIKHKEETGEDLPYDYVPEASKETFRILHEAYYEMYPELKPGYVPYHDNSYDENGVRMRIAEQQDAEYMRAVEADDMETAQRMVREAFLKAFPDTKIVDEDGLPKLMYHGTGRMFNVFRNSDTASELGAGFYFTDSPKLAEWYMNPENQDNANKIEARAMEIFEEMGHSEEDAYDNEYVGDYNRAWDQAQQELFSNPRLMPVFLNITNPRLVAQDGNLETIRGEWDGVVDSTFATRHRDLLRQARVDYAMQAMAYDPNQIKSAEAVTRDDQGNVIPLSQRFNPESNDIRFRTTYHGSGAIFDKFDTRFMSTGEGNQAYGWGTYVTTNQETGRKYAEIASATETGGFKPGATSKDIIAAQIYGIMDRDPLKSFDDAKRELKEEWADDRYTAEDLDSFLESDLGKYGPRQIYTVEIPDDNGENYLHWDKPITRSQSKKIIDGIKAQIGDRLIEEYGDEKSVDYELKSALGYGTEGSRVEGALDYFFGNEMNYATGENPGAERNSKFLNSLGIVGMEIPIDRNGEQRYKGSNYVIYNTDDAVISDRVSFRMENNNQRMFISNAEQAVEGLNMGKAAPAAWLKAIQGRGGLKAGEDKWLGLSDWLNASDKKSITKDELLDFIRENMVRVEEVHYSDGSDFAEMDKIFPGFSDAFDAEMDMDHEYYVEVKDIPAAARLYEKYRDEYGNGVALEDADVQDYAEMANAMLANNISDRAIDQTRLDYTTKGLENKREIALTVPTIESWNKGDNIHFGDAGQGRAVAWIRFGDTNIRSGEEDYKKLKYSLYDKYGTHDEKRLEYRMSEEDRRLLENAESNRKKRVLVIDEIQSKRHQEGRDKGYAASGKKEAQRQLESFIETMKEKYQGDDYSWADNASSEDLAEYDRLLTQRNGTITGVPDAPFEKNWHELAMKRMLRLAAEEGYDYVAWTKGEQQAERYSLSSYVDMIELVSDKDGRRTYELSGKGMNNQISVDENGNSIEDDFGSNPGTPLSSIVGKDLAAKMSALQLTDDEDTSFIDIDGMAIGGEGMKGFYDDILPRFMDKYGKKWGVKTQDIVLPNVEEAGRTMHAVPVTDAMKESVMQGQLMFRIVTPEEDARFTERAAETAGQKTDISDAVLKEDLIKLNGSNRFPLKKAFKGIKKNGYNQIDYVKVEIDPHSKNVQVSLDPSQGGFATIGVTPDYIIKKEGENYIDPKSLEKELKWELLQVASLLNSGYVSYVTNPDRVSGFISSDNIRFRSIEITPETRQEMDVIRATAYVNGTFMKAPNGADTKLNEEQWLMVRTKAFKAWFGLWENDPENASKIVDENGEPRVMYHGTRTYGFNQFFNGPLIWAAQDREISDMYDTDQYFFDDETPTNGTYQLFVNLRNPLDLGNIENGVQDAGFAAIAEKLGMTPEELAETCRVSMRQNDYIYDATRTDQFADLVRKAGYDGVTALESKGQFPTVGVLEPSQVKSAANNNGEFGPDGDIRFKIENLKKAEDFIKRSLDENKSNVSYELNLPTATQRRIKAVMGRDFDSHNIDINGVRHGLKNHGVKGKKLSEKSIPIREEDALLIPYIMVNPDEVRKGTDDLSRESIRFYKNLSNGYVVVVEKEQKNSPDDMDTINIWAELSNIANAQHKANPGATSETVTISTSDAAKIRKDAINAIIEEGENPDFRITPEQDAEYMQAVEAGDMEKAQQMVADAFKAAYPNNKLGAKIFYKGKNGDWGNQVAGYFTDDFEFADHYGAGEVKEFFLNMENPYEYNFEGSGSDGDYEGWDGKRRNTYDIMEKADAEAKEKGLQPYDGYILRNVGEYSWPDSPAVDDYITRDTKNVKLADPVTYDDNGEVVPLSKRFDPETDDIRFRFVGLNGLMNAAKTDEEKQAVKDNFNAAKIALKRGEDPKKIKLATGWELGKDGRMRYEEGDFQLKDVKPFSGALPITLGEIIDDPELFAEYPGIAGIRLKHWKKGARLNGLKGGYSAAANSIDLSWDNFKAMKRPATREEIEANGLVYIPGKYTAYDLQLKPEGRRTILHEIQHAIQHAEGFARGGTSRALPADIVKNEYDQAMKDLEAYRELDERRKSTPEYDAREKANALDDIDAWMKAHEDYIKTPEFKAWDDAFTKFMTKYGMDPDVLAASDDKSEAFVTRGASTIYKRLAGEAEARNVEKRSKMSDKARRASLAEETADVPYEEQIVRFRVIEDPLMIAELEAGPKIKVYRAMQLVDGKLYPPMSAREKVEYVTKNGKTRTKYQWRTPIELGKWEQSEEHPELANEDGTFTLDKGNGSTVNAAYNPYFHTSRTPLNDQFASAWNRPELVTVEVEVPESELNGDYKAEKAKDSVGEKEWKAGVVQGQLTGTRKVILSRYDKPIRIVPDSEVADEIVKMFDGKDVEIPFNVINESLRDQLIKRGVRISEPAKGNAGAASREAYEDWKDQQGDVRLRISEQPGLSLDLMGIHEQIKSDGLDIILGNGDVMDIYSELPESIRVRINGNAIKNGYNFSEATKQFFASLAEKTDLSEDEQTAIDEACSALEEAVGMPVLRDDALWMFYQDQHRNGRDPLDILRDVIVADRLGFSPQALERKENLDRDVRLRTVNAQYDATAADYYSTSLGFHAAINESLKDQFESVNKLVEAIEKTSGKKAKAFEDVRLALNQLSSKNFADKNVYLRDYLRPMWDVVRTMVAYSPTGNGKQRIVRAATLEDIVKYVSLKHGLERNETFAKRDAIEEYRKEYEAQVDEIKRDDNLSQDEKDRQIDAAERVFEANKAMVNAGQDSKYLEKRQQDYSGLKAWFYTDPVRRPKRLPNEGRDSYMKRLMKLRQPMFDLLEDAEDAAQQYVDGFEARMTVPTNAVASLVKQRGTVKLNGETKLTDLLWDRINAATKETLRHQRDAGMITKATYDNLSGMFQYYVPLRGFKEDTAEDVYAYYHNNAENSFSAPVLHAKGRRSMSDNPFGVIGQMAESAIQQDNKNKAKQALYFFVSNRAGNGLAELSKVWLSDTGLKDANGRTIWKKHYPKLRADMTQDEIEQAWNDLAASMAGLAQQGVRVRQGIQGLDIKTNFVKMDDKSMPEHFINVKVNGQDYDIMINSSPRAAQAIAGKFNIESGDNLVWKAILQIQRRFSALATSLNPEFGITNFFRDMMFGSLSVWVEHGTAFAIKYHWNLLKLLMGGRVSRLNANYNISDLKRNAMTAAGMQKSIEKNHPELVALWKEYVENGGPTGYTVLTDNKEYDKKMDDYLKAQLDPVAVRGAKGFFSWVSEQMESIEQIGRFAAYITSRQEGESVIDSVNAAKEATLNFNRKGSGKMMTPKDLKSFTFSDEPALAAIQKAAVYALTTFAPLRGTMMFFNAAVQSFAKWLKMWGMAPGKMTLNAAWNIALAFGLAMLHAGGDDDDEYLDQAIYERRSALLLGTKRPFVKIPISQEMVPYFAIGDILATEVILKKYPDREPVREIVEAFGELLPLNPATETPGREASTAFAAFSPIIDLASNKNFYGASIRPEKPYMSEGEKMVTPKYEYSYERTAEWAKETSKILNDLTNGKDNISAGWLNPSPENIEYLVSQTFKGTGTFLDRVVKSIEMTADIATDPEKTIKDIDLKSVPFVSRLVVDSGDDKLGSYTAEVYNWYTRELLPEMAALEKRAKDSYKSEHEDEIEANNAKAKELKDERTKINRKIAGLKRRKKGYLVSEMEAYEKQVEELTKQIDALENWLPAQEYISEELKDNKDYQFYLKVKKSLKGSGSGSSVKLQPDFIKNAEDMIRDRKGQYGETLTDKNIEDLKREVNLMKEQWVDQMNQLYYNR